MTSDQFPLLMLTLATICLLLLVGLIALISAGRRIGSLVEEDKSLNRYLSSINTEIILSSSRFKHLIEMLERLEEALNPLHPKKLQARARDGAETFAAAESSEFGQEASLTKLGVMIIKRSDVHIQYTGPGEKGWLINHYPPTGKVHADIVRCHDRLRPQFLDSIKSRKFSAEDFRKILLMELSR